MSPSGVGDLRGDPRTLCGEPLQGHPPWPWGPRSAERAKRGSAPPAARGACACGGPALPRKAVWRGGAEAPAAQVAAEVVARAVHKRDRVAGRALQVTCSSIALLRVRRVPASAPTRASALTAPTGRTFSSQRQDLERSGAASKMGTIVTVPAPRRRPADADTLSQWRLRQRRGPGSPPAPVPSVPYRARRRRRTGQRQPRQWGSYGCRGFELLARCIGMPAGSSRGQRGCTGGGTCCSRGVPPPAYTLLRAGPPKQRLLSHHM